MPTFYSQSGITVLIETPVFASEAKTFWQTFSDDMIGYSHVIGADGGFLSARIDVGLKTLDLSDWLVNGLGRNVTVFGRPSTVVFNGFVNRISIDIGTLAINRGPLFDVANRVSVVYTPIIDLNFNPPIVGVTTETLIAEDTTSQTLYGIIEKILSGGQLVDDGTTNEAEEARDIYLSEMSVPYTDETLNISGTGSPISMSLEVLGYYEWFRAYAYNDTNPLSVQFTTKINDVIDADPNGIFSSDRSDVDSNAMLTSAFEDQNRIAETVIRDMVIQGDGQDTRWLFGVHEDRRVYYNEMPTEYSYQHRVTSEGSFVLDQDTMQKVDPWDVRPGRWVLLVDFPDAPGLVVSGLRADPRAMFIERVSFSSPDNLTLESSRVNTVEQRLAQLGVRGA